MQDVMLIEFVMQLTCYTLSAFIGGMCAYFVAMRQYSANTLKDGSIQISFLWHDFYTIYAAVKSFDATIQEYKSDLLSGDKERFDKAYQAINHTICANSIVEKLGSYLWRWNRLRLDIFKCSIRYISGKRRRKYRESYEIFEEILQKIEAVMIIAKQINKEPELNKATNINVVNNIETYKLLLEEINEIEDLKKRQEKLLRELHISYMTIKRIKND